jgi:hypothetical protein
LGWRISKNGEWQIIKRFQNIRNDENDIINVGFSVLLLQLNNIKKKYIRYQIWKTIVIILNRSLLPRQMRGRCYRYFFRDVFVFILMFMQVLRLLHNSWEWWLPFGGVVVVGLGLRLRLSWSRNISGFAGFASIKETLKHCVVGWEKSFYQSINVLMLL